MFGSRIKKIIIEEVDKLSFSQQKKLHEYACAMIASGGEGVPGSALLKFAGMFDRQTISEMKEAVSADCEKVERGGW